MHRNRIDVWLKEEGGGTVQVVNKVGMKSVTNVVRAGPQLGKLLRIMQTAARCATRRQRDFKVCGKVEWHNYMKFPYGYIIHSVLFKELGITNLPLSFLNLVRTNYMYARRSFPKWTNSSPPTASTVSFTVGG